MIRPYNEEQRPKAKERIVGGAEVAPTPRARIAAATHRPLGAPRRWRDTHLEPMVPRESAGEVAKDWTKSSNAPKKAAARAIPGQSICKCSNMSPQPYILHRC
jgi:hypothetical protein